MLKKTLTTLAALCIAGAASAATISSTGDFQEIAAPAAVTNGSPSSNGNILYFNEMQGVTLAADLTTDQGVISAGTRVDSHMFFLNRVRGRALISRSGTLTFARNILGTISDEDGALLSASDFLGAPTTYANFNNRGIELGGNNGDTVSFIGDTVTANLIVTQPGDWVRVVTVSAVPVPAGIALLPLGLGGLAMLRRRRKES